MAAHLALLGLVFQVAALDHWTPARIENVRGIEQTHLHATHCHGSLSSCADGGSAPAWLTAAPAVLPAPPHAKALRVVAASLAPGTAPAADILHPPRAA
jgi:hypothetical protein